MRCEEMIYGYARVSTIKQSKFGTSLKEQEKELKEMGAEIIYSDIYTGTKKDRPNFTKLLSEVKSGDTVCCTKLDRFSRNLINGIQTINELSEKGVIVHIKNLGIIDNTTTGKLITNILLSVAQFEAEMIKERMLLGKQESGHFGGRKKTYYGKRADEALKILDTHTYKETEIITGISVPTLARLKRAKKDSELAPAI